MLHFALGIEVEILFERNEQKDWNVKPDRRERPKKLKHSYSGKGNFGQVLEKFYFGYEPNSTAEADFAQIGMELKSSPLKQLKNNE